MKVDINISCCLCSASFTTDIELPDKWNHRYGGIDDSLAFCDRHSNIAEWADSQCPGCVGGWTNCSLWNRFAYSSLDLTSDDFELIEKGICPKRVSGTFVISKDGFNDVDLSETASIESGIEFAKAIREYCDTYHKSS